MNASPNYEDSMLCFGGNLKDFSTEQKATRYFPGPRKRKVTATVQTWVGQGDSRASHYYVRLVEEHNYFWDGTQWVRCWDEPENGLSLSRQTKSRARISKLIQEMFKSNFDSKTHKLEIQDYSEILDTPRFMGIDGD